MVIQGSKSQYSWAGVLEFLYEEHQNISQRQSIWFIEKSELLDQIKQLEGELAANQLICNDLKQKNNMLEYCIRKIKNQGQEQQSPVLIETNIKIPQRRPKPNRSHLNKILCSCGIPNILDDIKKDLEQKVPKSNFKIDMSKIQDKSKINNQMQINYQEIETIGGHQDGVRDILFLQNKEYMVTVSQDCLMKIWGMKKGEKTNCLATIRDHQGPIFTLVEGDGMIFTGGMEGLVRSWNVPSNSKQLLRDQNMLGCWSNSFGDKYEPIWQLAYKKSNKLLFSTSSQISIKAYQLDLTDSKKITSTFRNCYNYQFKNVTQLDDIPTAICLHNDNLYAGYVNSHSLVCYDIQSGKMINQLIFSSQQQVSTNRLLSYDNVVLGAFEDKMIRIFQNDKMVQCFEAHTEPVMSISTISNNYQFFSCGHDGMVKLWDFRKLKPIHIFNAHQKKYDEAIHCITTGKHNITASGGADSIIKIFQPI